MCFRTAVTQAINTWGDHGTGKTGNLDVNFSRQGKQGIWLI